MLRDIQHLHSEFERKFHQLNSDELLDSMRLQQAKWCTRLDGMESVIAQADHKRKLAIAKFTNAFKSVRRIENELATCSEEQLFEHRQFLLSDPLLNIADPIWAAWLQELMGMASNVNIPEDELGCFLAELKDFVRWAPDESGLTKEAQSFLAELPGFIPAESKKGATRSLNI